jgi:hypothetical protein
MTFANALLAFNPDLIQQDVARVAEQLIVSHGDLLLFFFFLFFAGHLDFASEYGFALQVIQGLTQLKITL